LIKQFTENPKNIHLNLSKNISRLISDNEKISEEINKTLNIPGDVNIHMENLKITLADKFNNLDEKSDSILDNSNTLDQKITTISYTLNKFSEDMDNTNKKNTNILTDQIENIFKLFSMFDIKAISDGLSNILENMNGQELSIIGTYENTETLSVKTIQIIDEVSKIIPA
jgi:hypothetical protein